MISQYKYLEHSEFYPRLPNRMVGRMRVVNGEAQEPDTDLQAKKKMIERINSLARDGWHTTSSGHNNGIFWALLEREMR